RFDRHDAFARDRRDRSHAGARGFPVDMNGAGAALRHAATILGAGQVEEVTHDPEQRRVGRGVEIDGLAVQVESDHGEVSVEDPRAGYYAPPPCPERAERSFSPRPTTPRPPSTTPSSAPTSRR